MKRPNPNLYPTFGWEYVHEPDKEFFRASSKDRLVSEVSEYLEQTGADPKTALDLIDAYICRRAPSICSENAPPVPEADAETQRSSRIAAFVARSARKVREAARPDSVFVPRALTEARAAACRNCPFQFQHKVSCGTCNQSLIEAGHLLANLSPTPAKVTNDLLSCKHFDVFLPVFVRLRNAKSDDSAPEGCWRRVS